MSLLLSCISTRHSLLKSHWEKFREENPLCPITTLGSHQKPQDDQGGLLCLLNDNGQVQASTRLSMPAGMALDGNSLLVAAIDKVYEVAPDLTNVEPHTISLPAFNMLHSLSRTRQGYLAASTGTDAILEFNRQGQLLWSWWATEHGFEHTPTGERRVLDPKLDHRGIKYGTLAHTTHVNSAAELPGGTVLATLFHQGVVVAIDRESGDWRPVLEELDHPHSIRVLAEDYFTVADTGRGRALLVRIKNGVGQIEASVQVDTNWLQDCCYDYANDRWILVDGKHSRIQLRSGTAGEKHLARFDLDPEWRLYEALPLAG